MASKEEIILVKRKLEGEINNLMKAAVRDFNNTKDCVKMLQILGMVVEIKDGGLDYICTTTGFSKTHLKKLFAGKLMPRFDTFMKIIDAVDFNFTIRKKKYKLSRIDRRPKF